MVIKICIKTRKHHYQPDMFVSRFLQQLGTRRLFCSLPSFDNARHECFPRDLFPTETQILVAIPVSQDSDDCITDYRPNSLARSICTPSRKERYVAHLSPTEAGSS